MVCTGEALTAFQKLLDDLQWVEGGTAAYQEREKDGHVERREYDMAAAIQAFTQLKDAINGHGNEQKAAERLLDVVQAAQWHE